MTGEKREQHGSEAAHLSDDVAAPHWVEDLLGPDFQQVTIPLADDPDGEGEIVATLVRHLPGGVTESQLHERPAILYVHGLSDYFFQTHEAEFFTDQGFAFYGLDLRKCGRSHRPGQTWHYVSDLSFHFEEISAAASIICAHHDSLIPMGHSTGGLILPLWVDHVQHTAQGDFPFASRLSGLILNSPWLGMQYNPALVVGAKLASLVMSRVSPMTEIKAPGGGLSAYGKSVSKSHYGEWEFDSTMKPVEGHSVYWGFIATVMAYQDTIQHGKVHCDLPILVLSSAKSWLNKPYSAATDTADAVLNVHDVAAYAPKLGPSVDLREIESARHDIFLSLPTPRKKAFELTLDWLRALQA